nr:VOC family protein [uncultured Draconibacterium sp.]
MIFRAARHTNDLKPLIEFYTNIVGLDVLGSFKDHDNYDGVFLGKHGQNWHLEFTKSLTKANHKFDADDILVFYTEQATEYDKILEKINFYGIEIIMPENPYWRNNGVMIKDPDGYSIVISNQKNQ